MAIESKRRGRPRGKVRETHTVYLRLPVAMVAEVRLLAQEKGWTLNRLVETLLHDILQKPNGKADGGM
jgi:hypothetical protein